MVGPIKISQMPAASTGASLTGSELVPLVQSGANVQTPISTLGLPIVTPQMFGAVTTNGVPTADSSAALQAFFTYINTHDVFAVCRGNFGLKSSLLFDGATLYQAVTRNMIWDCVLWDISATGLDQLITFKNCQNSHSWLGQLTGYGAGSSTYTTRKTKDIFVFDSFMGWMAGGFKIHAVYGLRWGFRCENFNTQMSLPYVRCEYCGTANDPQDRLQFTVNTIVNTGLASNDDQRSTVTLTAGTPLASLPTSHMTVGHVFMFRQVSAGVFTAHYVTAINNPTSVEVWPWVDTAAVGGIVYFVYGGGVYMDGSDTSVNDIGYLDATGCGMALWSRPLYPPRIGSMTTQANGAGVVIGSMGNAVECGSIGQLYVEANMIDILAASQVQLQSFVIQALVNQSNDTKLVQMSSVDALFRNFATAQFRVQQRGGKAPVEVVSSRIVSTSPTITPTTDFGMPTLVIRRDAPSIALKSNQTLAYLTGKVGYFVATTGSGSNGQTTGNVTFTCEADWKINGGVLGASAVFTVPARPTLFAVAADYLGDVTGTAKNWVVCPVGGHQLAGSAAYDPPNLVDGAGTTTTVTVTGAALGDFVEGISFSLDLQGITTTAWVSAADTVSVRLQNETGGTLDLGAGTLRALVLKA